MLVRINEGLCLNAASVFGLAIDPGKTHVEILTQADVYIVMPEAGQTVEQVMASLLAQINAALT
jgi:hypothetical protein